MEQSLFDVNALAALPDVTPGVENRRFPQDRRPRLVATGYGGSVLGSFSGSSAALAAAGMANGTLDGAFTLFTGAPRDRSLDVKGALWKARRLLHSESTKGFKFSSEFNHHVWHRHLAALAGTDIVSNYQLYSAEFFDKRAALDIRGFYYLDGTLHDYLRGYRAYEVGDIDPATVDRAIDLERAQYHQADGIAVMSEYVLQTLVSTYDLPRDRITVVLPGANVTDAMADDVIAARRTRPARAEFVLGFVGLYPERKGLPKLAAAVARLRSDNVAVRLQVVGRCPADIAAMDGVDALGIISKTDQPDRFAQALARIDIGCQLSTAELSGIALLEFLRCEIPVVTTAIGGLPDILQGGGGIGVPADISVEEVATVLRRIIDDETEFARLSAEASQHSERTRWAHSAAGIGELIGRTAQTPT